MAVVIAEPQLHVEGQDDQYVIEQLLTLHGIAYQPKPSAAGLPEVKAVKSIEQLLRSMPLAIETSGGRTMGFVMDADEPLAARWDAVRTRLSQVGMTTPSVPPADGFVDWCDDYQTQVGVWLIPDNQHDGKLETFLQMLIAGDDALIGHAESSTDTAKSLGANFRDVDRAKAVMHAWLAWQEDPGKPFGTAIRARFFQHDAPAALAFVDWFKRLFEL